MGPKWSPRGVEEGLRTQNLENLKNDDFLNERASFGGSGGFKNASILVPLRIRKEEK